MSQCLPTFWAETHCCAPLRYAFVEFLCHYFVPRFRLSICCAETHCCAPLRYTVVIFLCYYFVSRFRLSIFWTETHCCAPHDLRLW
ncbi:hypothetical protein J2X17_002287 [Flavobacterium aquidurense]|nr:hypothetical protein [Flavobacterium aquidurense]